MFVKPADGLRVVTPGTHAVLPAEGAEVPDHDEYWIRRLRDGDVVRADRPPLPQEEALAQLAVPVEPHEETH